MPEMSENVSVNNESERADWQRNHLAIQLCISETLTKEKRMPTFLEMEVATALSEKTIRRHSKSLDMQGMLDRSRLLAEDVFVRQALRARASGDHNEAKTYAKLNFGWAEKSETNLTGSVQHTHLVGKPVSELSKEELIAARNDETLDIRDGQLVRIAEFTDISEHKPQSKSSEITE